ncbi:PIN domain-containing protein [Nocardia rhizosphaerae]|uniref:Ribonuclease VapC n=1 Tax=Nocardia rhizosphaerae TaxID=1691571 RepID=A0ABV8L5M3_9NOCA
MAIAARYLADTSALARMRHTKVAGHLAPLIDAGSVATCAAIDAEMLYSARSPVDYEQIRADRRLLFEYLPINDEHWHSAFAIQRELARSGRHRAVGIHDLLASVLAIEHRLVLIHYDADFESVASIVDLNHRWVAPRGTLEQS